MKKQRGRGGQTRERNAISYIKKKGNIIKGNKLNQVVKKGGKRGI